MTGEIDLQDEEQVRKLAKFIHLSRRGTPTIIVGHVEGGDSR